MQQNEPKPPLKSPSNSSCLLQFIEFILLETDSAVVSNISSAFLSSQLHRPELKPFRSAGFLILPCFSMLLPSLMSGFLLMPGAGVQCHGKCPLKTNFFFFGYARSLLNLDTCIGSTESQPLDHQGSPRPLSSKYHFPYFSL